MEAGNSRSSSNSGQNLQPAVSISLMGASPAAAAAVSPPPPPPPSAPVVPAPQPVLAPPQDAQSQPFERTFHLGGKRYLIFRAPLGVISSVHIVEWSGQKMAADGTPNKAEGIELSLAQASMLVNQGEQFSIDVDRISSGQKNISRKLHIGASIYISVNSPYRLVSLRKWSSNSQGNMFTLREFGISLKPAEWREMVKHLTAIWSDYIELYSVVSCIADPNVVGHNPMSCPECGHMDLRPRGELPADITIPL